ncbi:MAG: hypothetical protein AAF826_03005 [Pseudomonadota bacterium]
MIWFSLLLIGALGFISGAIGCAVQLVKGLRRWGWLPFLSPKSVKEAGLLGSFFTVFSVTAFVVGSFLILLAIERIEAMP